MYIRTSEFVSFKHIQYSTWCQNRGRICISSTRRTYRLKPTVSCIHPVIQTRNNNSANRIISSRRGEERFQYIFSVFNFNQFKGLQLKFYKVFLVFPHEETILHIELILPQEISKKYFNYKARPMQADTRHPPVTVPRASKHSTQQKPSW